MLLDPEMAEIAKVFLQESREGLDAMESGLLGLDKAADRERIDTIFRAAHSIKGGSATFGFEEIASFTHGVETLLDEMRRGVRQVTAEAIHVLLQACDGLREMFAAVEAEQAFDQERIANINKEIKHVLGASSDASVVPSAAGKAPPAPATLNGWRIIFEPVADLLRLRNEPARMFRELERLGDLVVHADISRLPVLDLLDPELCYIGWEIEMTGSVSRDELDEVFDWVDPRSRIDFSPIGRAPSAPGDSPNATGESPSTPGDSPRALGESPSAPLELAQTPPSPRSIAEASRSPADTEPKPPPGGAPPKANAEAGSIRVATGKLDNIINLVGELLITQSMLCGFAERVDPSEIGRLRQGLSQLSRNTRELQESVMQIRMLPISFAFNRFPRIVHDLSLKLDKKVELKLTGEGTELDKTVLEKISDPLVHLVRNALDHGLETPERRRAAGKTETGTLQLAAFHEGGNIIIEVRDDGAGLNKARILQRARERALIASDQTLTDEQIDNLIFMPGFSTAEQINDISGRGVGMDVVRRNINDLGGHVQLFSKEGQGSTIRIRLPLTLAILDGQLVRVGGETYIISLLAIIETVQVAGGRLNRLEGRTEVFQLRDEYLPIIKLCEHFCIEPESRNANDGLLVVIEADGQRVGLLVDDLLGQQQVVIKSLEANFKAVRGIAGATILGDGTVAFIIDVPGLIRSAGAERRGAALAAHAA